MSEDTKSWAERANDVLDKFFTGYTREITGQQLRADLEADIGPTPNPYVFGPFVAAKVRSGALLATGRKVKMTGREAHGRLTPVYLI